MSSSSHFEYLANEILLDIFDYLRPIDLLRSFTLLNDRFEQLLLQSRIDLDLSNDLSLGEFTDFCSIISSQYSSSIYSLRLSNVETCGIIRFFLNSFAPFDRNFSNLKTMSFLEPNEHEFKQIIQMKHFTSLTIKVTKLVEQQFPLVLLFDMPHLTTLTLSYDDVLPVNRLRSHSTLKRFTLDGFYINDLHKFFDLYPSLESLKIHRLRVNFRGYLPLFSNEILTLQTLHLNCFYTVRFDYLVYLLSFFPRLSRLSLITVGLDFLHLNQWMNTLNSLKDLRTFFFDIKAIIETWDDDLIASFSHPFWQRWPLAVDYSEDNRKIHLFTVPYRRKSFISTIHHFPVVCSSNDAFHSVTDLYLKTNLPMETRRKTDSTNRFFPNVHALQIYQNAPVPIDYSLFIKRIPSIIDPMKLVHLELFISLPASIFLSLLHQLPSVNYFKTDYEILLSLTDRLRHEQICRELRMKLKKLVIRRDPLPMVDHERFLHLFSHLKHLKFNLTNIRDLRYIAAKYVKTMFQLRTLQIWLVQLNEQVDKAQWEGILNGISYEIAERHIKIWK